MNVEVAPEVKRMLPPVMVSPEAEASPPVAVVRRPPEKVEVAEPATYMFPLTAKVAEGEVVPMPTSPLPPTQNAGVEVPSSETTKAVVELPISTDSVPYGVEEAMPTFILAPPVPPIPPLFSVSE